MAKRKKQKKQKIDYNNLTDPKRIEEQKYLRKWEKSKSAPSVWEKMDQDPSYESALRGRVGDGSDPKFSILKDSPSMSNKWGIGKPKVP